VQERARAQVPVQVQVQVQVQVRVRVLALALALASPQTAADCCPHCSRRRRRARPRKPTSTRRRGSGAERLVAGSGAEWIRGAPGTCCSSSGATLSVVTVDRPA